MDYFDVTYTEASAVAFAEQDMGDSGDMDALAFDC